jgi:hypothetical protein
MNVFLIKIYILLKIASEKATRLDNLFLANSLCFKIYTIQLIMVEIAEMILKMTPNYKITSLSVHYSIKKLRPIQFNLQLIKSTNS